ncbi:unnamed protein product [Orchesella dallaii]|uniref:Methyl farnesoate epoxidase n=1 Tax=Orchesella dallaii TaxID=48710 RepID=A0ABP1RBK9_9HEXA
MIDFLSSVLTAILVVILILLLQENFKGRDKQLAPGPFRFPVVGNLLQITWINSKEPYLAFTKLSRRYGDIMSIQLGSVYAVVFNSFEMIEESLTKPEFSDRFFNGWLSERTFQKQLGIVFSKYPFPWQQLRRFSLRTLRDFGFGKKSRMHSIIHAELDDVVGDIKKRIKKDNGIITFDGYFTISTLNLVWSMMVGTRYEHSDPKLIRLTKVAKDFFASSNTANNILLAYPEWRNWFPNWTGMTVQRNCYHETNHFFQGIIDERKRLGVYKTMPENLIDEFLYEIESQSTQDGADNETVFTEEQLIGLMSDFFLAGTETSSNTLAWCMLYLLTNPQVQKKLQNEIDAVIPLGSFLTSEHEPLLHYTKATLAETHRMASVFPLMVPRAALEDTYCGEFFVPKGTYIMANIYNVHHDKCYWKDPEIFRPERFIDDNGQFIGDPRLKPFGFGRRVCLGEPLASMSLLHYLTVLMQNFTFNAVSNEPIPSVNPVVGITNAPQACEDLDEHNTYKNKFIITPVAHFETIRKA